MYIGGGGCGESGSGRKSAVTAGSESKKVGETAAADEKARCKADSDC